MRWEGRQPVKLPPWVPGTSSSHLGTRDIVEAASESSCLKGEREWVLSYEMLLVEDRGGEGARTKVLFPEMESEGPEGAFRERSVGVGW